MHNLLFSHSSFAGLLKELLKSDHFVSVIMSSSGREADSESASLLEGENPLPLVLKKVSTKDDMPSYNMLSNLPADQVAPCSERGYR